MSLPPRSPEEITRLIEIYPPSWRRWCNAAFEGGCACRGCVLWPAPSTVRGDPEGKLFPNPDDRLSKEEVEIYLALKDSDSGRPGIGTCTNGATMARICKQMLIIDRFHSKQIGWVIVLNERAKRGDVVRCGDRTWTILGVETFRILNPPLPWGFLLGETAPETGDEVTIEKGPNHDSTKWPGEP